MKIINLLKSLFTLEPRWEGMNREAERLKSIRENRNRVEASRFNPVAQSRTPKQVAEGLPAEHLELPSGFKFEQRKPIEVELSVNDILVIHTEKLLTDAQKKYLIEALDIIREKPNANLVLDAGVTYSVIHKAKP
jgi:hypothetical protein